MNQPFWLANSILFFFAILAFAVSFFSAPPRFEREDIEIVPVEQVKKEERQQVINIQQIYENDLFGTYKKEVPQSKPVVMPSPLPEPPKPQVIRAPEPQALKFLEPLNITLKGIVVVSSGDRKDRVIIGDNKTDQEAMYRVGDMIADAQLIRIFRNKIILLRSNGQQEVFYLREQDARFDPAYVAIQEWNKVAQEVGPNTYQVNIQEFVLRVVNLAQFFSLLSCTTAYKNGENVGIQIGDLEPKSLGVFLGLRKGDIVTTINGTSMTTNANRLALYKEIVSLQAKQKIEVVVQRQKKEIVLHYLPYQAASLTNVSQEKKNPQALSQLNEEQKELKLKEKYQLAPTIDEIKKRERQHMLEKGRAPHSEMTK